MKKNFAQSKEVKVEVLAKPLATKASPPQVLPVPASKPVSQVKKGGEAFVVDFNSTPEPEPVV